MSNELKNITLCGVLSDAACYVPSREHYKQVKGTFCNKPVTWVAHMALATLELIPVIGHIVAIFDRVIANVMSFSVQTAQNKKISDTSTAGFSGDVPIAIPSAQKLSSTKSPAEAPAAGVAPQAMDSGRPASERTSPYVFNSHTESAGSIPLPPLEAPLQTDVPPNLDAHAAAPADAADDRRNHFETQLPAKRERRASASDVSRSAMPQQPPRRRSIADIRLVGEAPLQRLPLEEPLPPAGPVVSAAIAAQTQNVEVNFSVKFDAGFHNSLKIILFDQTGENPTSEIQMTCQETENWTVGVEIPIGTKFKLAHNRLNRPLLLEAGEIRTVEREGILSLQNIRFIYSE